MNSLKGYLSACPIVAILRGIYPSEIIAIADALLESGVRIIEVPLNSPEPLKSIELLCKHAGSQALCGAGTVTDCNQVYSLSDVGAELIVAPNTNAEVIKAALQKNMHVIPGCASPTEAFSALKAGANALKLFPAGAMGLDYVKALNSVLPNGIIKLAVGGIKLDNIAAFKKLGIDGFGIGEAIYSPGTSADLTRKKVHEFLAQINR